MAVRSELDRKLIRSSAWVALSSGGTQVVALLVLVVLARLLTPHAFGLIALASLPLVALSYLQESGLTLAVIRRQTDVERAAATQLVFGFCSSVLLYAGSFLGAPLLARLFSQPELTRVLRVLALTLVLRGLTAAPGALLERELAFDKRARGDVAGALAQGIVSVASAVAGFGVWSLVAGQLANQAVQGACYWALAPFRPSPRLASWPMLRDLGRFGRHVAASNVLVLVNDNADNALIGRLLGASSVGLYNLAWRLANLPAIQIAFIVSRATFPVYSTVRDDLAEFREIFRATLRRISFLSIPVAVGLLVAAHPIVVGVFGERWHAAIGPLQALVLFGMIRTLAGVTSSVFQASGRPQLNYQLGLLEMAALFGMMYLLAPTYGINGVAWAQVISGASTMLPCYFFALRILELPLADLVADLAKPAACAAVVAVALLAALAAIHSLHAGAQLAVLITVGTAAYAATILTLGRSELRTIVGAFRARPAAES